MVKTIRLYVDYLEKTERISEEDAERLKKIFRVKNKTTELKPYIVDAERLVKVIHVLRLGVYRTILLLLFYSGARLSEVVKMLKTLSEDRLACFDSFYRYFLGWRRGKKRCDYIYFPKLLLNDITKVRVRLYLGGRDSYLLGKEEHLVNRDCLRCKYTNTGNLHRN